MKVKADKENRTMAVEFSMTELSQDFPKSCETYQFGFWMPATKAKELSEKIDRELKKLNKNPKV